MALFGSILLIGGVAGLLGFLLLMNLRPGLAPRGAAVAVIGTLFFVAGAGLVILTLATGGKSLHTGG